jgi:hypothetical protein
VSPHAFPRREGKYRTNGVNLAKCPWAVGV